MKDHFGLVDGFAWHASCVGEAGPQVHARHYKEPTMTTQRQPPGGDDLHISDFKGEGAIESGDRIAVRLEASSKNRIRMTLPLVLAERLGYSLLSFAAVARGGRHGEPFESAYPSDEARFSYDEVQCSARVDFRARGMRGISVRLSLSTLRELRAAIEKADS
jgi:hypothetical protein